MIHVDFYIDSILDCKDTFNELPSVTASYEFYGKKYECYKRETVDNITHDYYLREVVEEMFDGDCAVCDSEVVCKFTQDEIDTMGNKYKQALKDVTFPRDKYGHSITINSYGDHPLDEFGAMKGFL